MRKILAPILLVFVGLIGAVALVRSKTPVETSRPILAEPLVRVVTARTSRVPLTVTAQGTVLPRTETTLAAQIAATVTAVSPSFEAGGFFERGDVLIQLDSRDYELAAERTAALVAQAELRLTQQQAEARVAAAEWQELGQGQPDPLVLREPQLAEARAALKAAQAEHGMARLALERTRVRAPFTGRVHQKMVDLGQYLIPGQPLGTIHAIDYAEVRLPVADRNLAFLDLPLSFGAGDDHRPPAVVSARFAGRKQSWEGEVVRTEGELDRRSRMLNLVVRVQDPYSRLEPGRPPLAVGLFVDAEIAGNTVVGTHLPRTALRGDSRVLIVDEEERLWSREVEVLRVEKHAVVIGEGLKDGDRICVSPLDTVVEGMRVRILEADGLAELRPATTTAAVESPSPPPETMRVETASVDHERSAAPEPNEDSTDEVSVRESGRLLAMSLSSSEEETTIEVSVAGSFRYQTSRLSAPERFVVDLLDVVKANERTAVAVADGPVARVRVGQYQVEPAPISRVVFDMRRVQNPDIEQDTEGLTIRF